MNLDLPEIENKILKFWKEKKIFKKTLKKTRKSPKFIFFEGPPFANGLPGIHHLVARAFKDIILRYKTMQGFYVERRAGWDTHGLPTEMEAEKKLNIKTKKEIEKLGIDKFVKECKRNVFTYKKEWEEFTERIGFWLDFKNAYITCNNNYIESLWWTLKQIWDKGLLYQDYKVVPYCPRCGTSLSSHEVAQGYKTIEENSVYLKFKLKEKKNTYFLAWTTTPWTLPANVALAVNPGFKYVKTKINNEFLILAKERMEEGEIIEEMRGEDLVGLEYEPLFFQKSGKKAFYVVGADFVSLEEGTGIVHLAPAFGEDDMEVGKKNDLPILITVNEEGRFKTGDWKGVFVKEADPLIVEDLKKRGLLYKEERYEHEYPFCWRCKTSLIYYAKNSWFIKISGVKKELLRNSEEINWEPAYIKKGRFGQWLKEVKDWNLSRERYWGTPLPIWRCQNCKSIKIIGSIKELEKLSGKKIKDLHRPKIDGVVFKCDKCGGNMERVSEVADCWFDSGAMPFAQWYYPFRNRNKLDKKEFFPADFICEAMDQTRGWFYTLLAVSTLLEKGVPYKNVICLGLVLDAQGQKMSKSRGNIIKPDEVIDRFGADCARFYFYSVNSAGETKKFDFKDCQNLYRKVFDILWQSFSFFETYVSKKEFFNLRLTSRRLTKPRNFLDQWIISRLENLNSQVIVNLDNYDIMRAARLFIDFIDDLSNWYIRRSRDRFKNSDKNASKILYYVLFKTSLLLAPFIPFFSENLYRGLKGKKDSVHLEDYPQANKKLINKKLEEQMTKIREIVVLALAERAKAGIKVRQPLRELRIKNYELREKELLGLIKEEVNVKEVIFDNKMKEEIKLDTKITEDLEKEGRDREWIRNVNVERKKLGLTPNDTVIVKTTEKVFGLKKAKKEVKAKEIIFQSSGPRILLIKIK